MRTSLVLAVLLLLAPSAYAEPPAPMSERVEILEIEMRRGPAEALQRFLGPDAHPLSRWYAIRALGRIGDHGRAPAVLAALLEAGTDLPNALWAAGIAQTDKLYAPIQKHLASDRPEVVAAAAEALGWTKKADAIADLSPLLSNPDARIRAGALMGLARLRPEGLLERVVPFLFEDDAAVRRAAGFACWMIAGARRRAAKAQDEAWGGDLALAMRFAPLLTEARPDRRMDGLRAMGALLGDDHLDKGGLPALLAALAKDADARVVQDLVWRILGPRKTAASDALLIPLLAHTDPKVRHMVAEALGQHASDAAKAALAAAHPKEQDPRVREVFLVELARGGDESAWKSARGTPQRAQNVEPTLRQITDVRVLLLSQRAEALDELLEAARPPHAGGRMSAAALMEVLSGLEGREDARIEPWLRGFLEGWGSFDLDDPHVGAAAIGLVGKNRYWKLYAELKRTGAQDARDLLHPELRLALAEAFGELGSDAQCPATEKAWIQAWLRRAMYGDASAWVRAKARGALEQLGAEDLPAQDVLPPTDWTGLPRPTAPVLGVDVTTGETPLSEAEILQLADAIFAQAPRIRIETSQGAFEVALEPDAAPVHSVALVLAVQAGTYAGTRWHRVVPNFVIQGGDPRGHGAGNAGYFLPDEITRRSYVRGALGMPKSRKDDGGCQLFFMHTHYLPLDERYTCYGQVVSGMDVVDRIRVGDVIREATLVSGR